jgi:hypothetical protein
MLYSPSPGTPLYHDLAAKGQLKDEEEFPWADWHGQLAFSWRHPGITDGQETEFIVRAFERDFQANGPSVVRVLRTALKGWKRYKDHPNPGIRRRFSREARRLSKVGAAVVAATKEYYRDDEALHAKMSELLGDLCDEFGAHTQELAEAAGSHLVEQIRAEEVRLADGWAYEPPMFYETNSACRRLFADEYSEAVPSHCVLPAV